MLHTHAVKKREKSRASETTNLFISCERMRGIQKQNTPSPNLNFPFFVSLYISLLSSLPIPLPFLDPYSLHFITIFITRFSSASITEPHFSLPYPPQALPPLPPPPSISPSLSPPSISSSLSKPNISLRLRVIVPSLDAFSVNAQSHLVFSLCLLILFYV